MRDLEIDILKIEKLPLKSTTCKRIIQVENKLFVLNDTSVHTVENGNSVVTKECATSIDWVALDKILCMGDGSAFECFNADKNVRTIIEIPDGYVVHKWSPSEDRIALINSKKILEVVEIIPNISVYMSVAHYELDGDDPSSFTDVRTEFRESQGRTAELTDVSATQSFLDDSYSIVWRADGKFFAVSFVCNGIRIIKVFSMNCEFYYESNVQAGLCSQIAWKPNSFLIASEQRIHEAHKIIFFEKNELHRLEVMLSRNMNVSKIEFNEPGDILMVWQHDCEVTNAVSDEISLWTCCNWNWTQKQSLVFKREDQVNHVEWHGDWLQVITVQNLINYSWNWIVHQCVQYDSLAETSEEIKEDEVSRPLGAIAVIDGSKLRVTITVEAMLSPPMCHYAIHFNCPINHVIFGSESNLIAVVLNDYTVHIIELKEKSFNKMNEYCICREIRIPCSLNHFIYREKYAELYCIESLIGGTSFVNKYIYNTTVSESKCLLSPESITSIMRVNGPRNYGFHLSLCKGALTSRYHTKTESSKIAKDLDLVDGHNGALDRGGETSVYHILGHYYVFKLVDSKFFINGVDSEWNVTSFLIWQRCIFLTIDTLLFCVPLTEAGLTHNKIMKVPCKVTIPEGALLVVAIPGTRQIVLQVPGGDLEIVCPRILVINEIDSLITQGKYMQAYEMARTERINLNVFYDLDPPRFLANVESFIKDINCCEYLVIFLTQLSETNTTDELFSECPTEQPIYERSDEKLKLVILKMVEVMKQINYDFFLQPIVIGYIRLGTDDALDQAAREILEGKTRENNIDMHISPDEILSYMIMMISVEKMYEIALVLNDVDFIRWIGSSSNKDPKEYIPFLDDLDTMEPEFRLYKIYRHIKRYETALTHLIKCDNIQEELSEFVEEECLQILLIKHATPDNQWNDAMMCMYKDYLWDNKHYSDAGYICLNLRDYSGGLKMFLNSLQVQEYLFCLKKLELDDVETNLALVEIKNKLIEENHYKDASYILETQLKNYEDAIGVLILGKLWCDAQCLCQKYDRDDLLECKVLPNLLDYVRELKQIITSTHDEYNTLKTRLRIVRQQTQHLLAQGETISNEGGVQLETSVSDYELASAASTDQGHSTTSRILSTISTMTSSTARQATQLREDNPFENIAIIQRLHTLITNMQNLSENVTDACRILLLSNQNYVETNEVQKAYEWTINLMYTSIEEIWPPEMLIPPNPMTSEAIVLLNNLEHLDVQYRYPPPDVRKKWNKLLL